MKSTRAKSRFATAACAIQEHEKGDARHLAGTSARRVRSVVANGTLVAQIYDLNCVGGMLFPTPADAEMQCGFGHVPNRRFVKPHVHNRLARQTNNTSEFIFVMAGSISAVFYDEQGREIDTAVLASGMALLQFIGGHSFVIEPDTKYIEVKQGPYYGNVTDKSWLPVKSA